MVSRASHRAFTLAELALVFSGLGLLATVILPLPRYLTQRQRQTGCLANLGRLGAASQAYAVQDLRHQIVPLHAGNVTRLHGEGWDDRWGWRTVLPHAFGGQTATTAFPVEKGAVTVLLDEYWGGAPNPWGTDTRPLTALVSAGGGGPESFHCPADSGYPAALAGEWGDIPLAAAGVPCFDMLGNSYRYNGRGLIWASGPAHIGGALSVSPLGHTPEYVLEPQQTVLYCDPLFYCLVRHLAEGTVDPIVGWHGSLMADNVVYCDGSARLTEIGALYQFTEQEFVDLNVSQLFHDQLRGAGWQLDCYPAPGALISVFSGPGPGFPAALTAGWPWERFFPNDNPYGPGDGATRTPGAATAELPKGEWIIQ